MVKKETITFLNCLKKNNNKPWFEKHKLEYQNARENFEELVEGVIKGVGAFDNDIAVLTAKETIFRQYRDVRFSADKTPYKIHMGAYLNKGSKKVNTPGYYIHIQPGKSMIGGGLYQPESSALSKVRQEIDYNPDEWLGLISSKQVKKYFKNIPDNTDKLVRVPKGYDESNPLLEYLKLKSFVFTQTFPDETILKGDFLKLIANSFKSLHPLIEFLNRTYE